jgi:hypothetical protein
LFHINLKILYVYVLVSALLVAGRFCKTKPNFPWSTLGCHRRRKTPASANAPAAARSVHRPLYNRFALWANNILSLNFHVLKNRNTHNPNVKKKKLNSNFRSLFLVPLENDEFLLNFVFILFEFILDVGCCLVYRTGKKKRKKRK